MVLLGTDVSEEHMFIILYSVLQLLAIANVFLVH
jgi:hypothetical protein